jgi:hypothetical protein
VNQDVRVYVTHDNRISTKPSWLQSFTDTSDTIVNSDSTFGVFAKDFSAGTITLGGNEGGGNSSMYTVIIAGQGNDIDTTPPNSSISINNGAESTSSTSVTLSLSSDDNVGVTGYYLSTILTTPLASNPDWVSVTPAINFNADVPYTLSSGDGTKTVYVWYKDAAGNVSNAYSDSITLIANSNVAPVLDPIADITVNEGATITLSPTATDPDGNDLTYTYTGWMTSSSYTTNSNDVGTHTVTVTVSDGSQTDSQDVTITVTDIDTIQPSTPANLQATAIANTKMNLSWNASTDNVGVTGYRVYRDGIQVADVSSTTYKDTGLSKNTTYVYTVSAYDAAGNESSQATPLTSNTKSPGRPKGLRIVGT